MSQPSQGITGVGPAIYPCRSLSAHARRTGEAKQVFFSLSPTPSKIPCPYDPAKPVGNTVHLETIYLLVPCGDGRLNGSIEKGDAEARYDVRCFLHIPVSSRPSFPQHFTFAPQACTSYYCLHPDKIDPTFVAAEVPTFPTEPLLVPESNL